MTLVTVTTSIGQKLCLNTNYIVGLEPSVLRAGHSYITLANKDAAILVQHTIEELIEILNGEKP